MLATEEQRLTAIEVAELLGKDELTVRRWVWKGLRGGAVKLEPIQIGGRQYFTHEILDDFFRRVRTWKSGPPPKGGVRGEKKHRKEAYETMRRNGMLK